MKITRAERHPHCHPERSRGIFLAGGDNVVCGIAENGKPLAKGARNDGVQGRFLAALEMTTGGSVDEQKSNNRRVSFNPPAP